MTNLTLVCLVKIEYVTKSNIFGIKIMIKNGLEKIFWNSFMHKPILTGKTKVEFVVYWLLMEQVIY